MPKGDPAQVVAMRLSAADRERLTAHGHRPADAVRRLLDLADEHATCPPPKPKGRRGFPAPKPTTSTVHRSEPATVYRVMLNGQQVYATTNRAFADGRARDLPGSTVVEST